MLKKLQNLVSIYGSGALNQTFHSSMMNQGDNIFTTSKYYDEKRN